MKFFAKYKLLIIDEVGFLPLDSESSNLLFSANKRKGMKNIQQLLQQTSHYQDGEKYLEIMCWQTQYLTDLYTILTLSISQEGPIEQRQDINDRGRWAKQPKLVKLKLTFFGEIYIDINNQSACTANDRSLYHREAAYKAWNS